MHLRVEAQKDQSAGRSIETMNEKDLSPLEQPALCGGKRADQLAAGFRPATAGRERDSRGLRDRRESGIEVEQACRVQCRIPKRK